MLALDDELVEVLVEDVADDPDDQVGLGVQQRRRRSPWSTFFWMSSHCAGQPGDVAGELFLAGALGGGAHDDAGVLGGDLLEDAAQPGALGVGQLAADAGAAARPGT